MKEPTLMEIKNSTDGARISEIAFILGRYVERGSKTKEDLDLYGVYVLCCDIYQKWVDQEDIRTEEERGYITAYAERVLKNYLI